jgi:CheY-like chemotaxis protein
VLDLNTVVSELDKMLRRLIGEDIDLVTVRHETLGRVKADAGQIEQVLVNLILNARDAMPSGGKITIETSNVELDEAYARQHVAVVTGKYVMLSVTDTGYGMDAETTARIFEPFFTTKERSKGTGLGLSTVYGIVKQSGGNIWVYSEPGMGTTFKVYLPRVEEAIYAPETPATQPKATGGSETILLVEDEDSVRSLAREILQRNGYFVLEATHGSEALVICKQHKGSISLMLTDVVMPGMSGREVAEELSSLRPEMKVIFMSGYSDDAIVRHGILEPGTQFLPKPYTPDSLIRKVRDVLDENSPERSAK